jgi:hypothetical protein
MQSDNGKLRSQAKELYQHWKTVLKPTAPQGEGKTSKLGQLPTKTSKVLS